MNLANKYHPKYEPDKWNKDIFIKKTHNCYAYALNMINKKYSKICKELNKNSKNNCIFLKPQVGMYSGNYDNSKLTCEKMKIRLIKDNPKIKPINKDDLIPNHYYKIALSCVGDGSDYHFYRQDNNGYWSHKDGSKKATNKDAKRRLIIDPEKADRGRYNKFCGYFMVPNSSKYKRMSNKIE